MAIQTERKVSKERARLLYEQQRPRGIHTYAQAVKVSNTPARSEGNGTTQVAETEELVQDTKRNT